MGWFSHPALRSGKEGDERTDSGNFGTLDLIKALSWVRDNIEAFRDVQGVEADWGRFAIDDPACPINQAFCEDMAGWKKNGIGN